MKIKVSIILFFLLVSHITHAVELKTVYEIKNPSAISKIFSKIAFCKWRIPCYRQPQLGVSLTTVTGSTLVSDLDTIIMDNDNALNNGKIENSTTTLPLITTLSGLTTANSLTSASSLATVGTITSGTWQGTGIDVARQGTGTTSPSLYNVMLGNGASGFTTASSTGTSGQALTSNGANAYPSFQDVQTNQASNYTWTGLHSFNAGATSTNATTTGAQYISRSLAVATTSPTSNYPVAIQGGLLTTATTSVPILVNASSTCIRSSSGSCNIFQTFLYSTSTHNITTDTAVTVTTGFQPRMIQGHVYLNATTNSDVFCSFTWSKVRGHTHMSFDPSSNVSGGGTNNSNICKSDQATDDMTVTISDSATGFTVNWGGVAGGFNGNTINAMVWGD